MGSTNGAILVLVTEAVLLGLMRKYIIEKKVLLLCFAISGATALFAIANIEHAKTHLTQNARHSKAFAWGSAAILILLIALQAKYPSNDATQTLIAWNKETSGILCFALVGLIIFGFTSRASDAP